MNGDKEFNRKGEDHFQRMLDRTFNNPPDIDARIDAVELLFEKFFEQEFLEFDRIKNKKGSCPITHAFRMLDELFPSKTAVPMVTNIWDEDCSLRPSFEDVEKLTEEQVLDLVRCGVTFSRENDLLISM